MSKKCVAMMLLLLILATTTVAQYYQDKLRTVADVTANLNKTYSSKDLGVSFDYADEYSLNFVPRLSENQEKYEQVAAIGVDKLLYFIDKEDFETNSRLILEGYKEEGLTADDPVSTMNINGEDVKFRKLRYADGSPIAGCMWSTGWVSYVADVPSLGLIIELKTETESSCDREGEYKYTTSPERIETAMEILKTVRQI